MSSLAAARDAYPPWVDPDEPRDKGDVGYDIIDGECVERLMGAESGWVSARMIMHLAPFGLGGRVHVFGSDVACKIFPPPHDKKFPDVSVVAVERLPGGVPSRGWLEIPPDLVVESVSPHDDAVDVESKFGSWLAAGVPVVWVAYPESRRIWVYRADGSGHVLRDDDVLTGEGVLEGFAVPVRDLFPPPPPAEEEPPA